MTAHAEDDLEACFSGRRLYGDDLTGDPLHEWFDDEREGFADLGARNRDTYVYEHSALNRHHGYYRLPCAVRWWQKLRPQSVFYVLSKPASGLRADGEGTRA